MQIEVPLELQSCLREYTKAVLRDKPPSADILQYSKDFFVEKSQQIRMHSYKLPASTSKPFLELSPHVQHQIEDVFKRYDLDCDHSISLEELRILVGDLGGLFGFSEEVDASTLMALLDSDGNQEISWQVRCPCSVFFFARRRLHHVDARSPLLARLTPLPAVARRNGRMRVQSGSPTCRMSHARSSSEPRGATALK